MYSHRGIDLSGVDIFMHGIACAMLDFSAKSGIDLETITTIYENMEPIKTVEEFKQKIITALPMN